MALDILPSLEGTTLSGRILRFPEDLPEAGLVLVIGFTHGARHDVGAWKTALAELGIPYLSLPTAGIDVAAEAMEGVAVAMRAHVPRGGWDQVVQIYRGGDALLHTFGWQADALAKVVRVSATGTLLARHDTGPFTRASLTTFLEAAAASHR